VTAPEWQVDAASEDAADRPEVQRRATIAASEGATVLLGASEPAADRSSAVAGEVIAMSAEPKRVDFAVEAAVAIAATYGVVSTRPKVMHHSNNVVVHLAPAAVVAKVATLKKGEQAGASTARELAVARFLAERNAPMVPPTTILPAGPHSADGLELGFWTYCRHDVNDELDGRAAGRSLAALHKALEGYPTELPPFAAQVEHAAAVLADEPLPALPRDDRAFLADLLERLSARLDTTSLSARPLHGEVHLGNLLAGAEGLRWIDFEAACTGPLEWDLTGLPDAGVEVFDHVDSSLLALLREVRSCCVAAWCWRNPERAPELREAAELHLARLRRRHGRRSRGIDV